MLKEFSDYLKFRREIEKESDRGCALLVYSQLDNLTETLLKKKLVHNNILHKEIFSGTQFLATSSAKINLAFLLGLIGKDVFDDFGILRKIRNSFAYSVDAITFESEEIKSLCVNLKVSTRPAESSGRKKFFNTYQIISHLILEQIGLAEAISQKENFNLEKLIADNKSDKDITGFNSLDEKIKSGEKITEDDFVTVLDSMFRHFGVK